MATTTMFNGYLDWPGVAQVCRIEAEMSTGDEATHEVCYAITSVPRSQADAATLLGWRRGHWGIEIDQHRRIISPQRRPSRRPAESPTQIEKLIDPASSLP